MLEIFETEGDGGSGDRRGQERERSEGRALRKRENEGRQEEVPGGVRTDPLERYVRTSPSY